MIRIASNSAVDGRMRSLIAMTPGHASPNAVAAWTRLDAECGLCSVPLRRRCGIQQLAARLLTELFRARDGPACSVRLPCAVLEGRVPRRDLPGIRRARPVDVVNEGKEKRQEQRQRAKHEQTIASLALC